MLIYKQGLQQGCMHDNKNILFRHNAATAASKWHRNSWQNNVDIHSLMHTW